MKRYSLFIEYFVNLARDNLLLFKNVRATILKDNINLQKLDNNINNSNNNNNNNNITNKKKNKHVKMYKKNETKRIPKDMKKVNVYCCLLIFI